MEVPTNENRTSSIFQYCLRTYVFAVLLIISVMLILDDNKYDNKTDLMAFIYVFSEVISVILLPVIGSVFKIKNNRLFIGITVLSSIAWVSISIVGLIYWTGETVHSPLYYMMGYVYIGNIFATCCIFSVIIFLIALVLQGHTFGEQNTPIDTMMVNGLCSINKFINLVKDGSDTMCSICLEDFNENDSLKVLPCNHYFHDKCIKEWFEAKATCPKCRYDLMSSSTVYKN